MKPRELMADVSSNNGPISVVNYSRAGHVVLAVKATQGINYVNPYHQDQANLAHELGLTVVHYHWMSKDESIDQQIEHFRNIYNRAWRDGDYPCFDIEEAGIGVNAANKILRDYYLKTHHEPILYGSRDFIFETLKGIIVPGRRLWVADYSTYPVIVDKRHYILWARQYTDGLEGPEPHFYSGIGKSDGSYVSAGPARAMMIRKLRTRRRK